jgi:ketosteroid isomerase-like protein
MSSTGNVEANKALMARVARAFVEGDLQPLLDALDENAVWTSNSPVEFFRIGGTRRNSEGTAEQLALLSATYVFRRFDPKEIVAEGDTVWGLFAVAATHLPTGKPVTVDLAIRWVVRNEKILSHQGFFDSASMLIQQGEIQRPTAA